MPVFIYAVTVSLFALHRRMAASAGRTAGRTASPASGPMTLSGHSF